MAFATEAAQRIVDDAVQIFGGRGVLADSLVDRLYRAVRALRIYEGTTEVQHLIVARALLEEDPDRVCDKAISKLRNRASLDRPGTRASSADPSGSAAPAQSSREEEGVRR